jgi:hypothetical protein
MPIYIDYKKVRMDPIATEQRDLNQRPYSYSMILDVIKPAAPKEKKVLLNTCDNELELVKSQSETQATEGSTRKKSRIKVKIRNKEDPRNFKSSFK